MIAIALTRPLKRYGKWTPNSHRSHRPTQSRLRPSRSGGRVLSVALFSPFSSDEMIDCLELHWPSGFRSDLENNRRVDLTTQHEAIPQNQHRLGPKQPAATVVERRRTSPGILPGKELLSIVLTYLSRSFPSLLTHSDTISYLICRVQYDRITTI